MWQKNLLTIFHQKVIVKMKGAFQNNRLFVHWNLEEHFSGLGFRGWFLTNHAFLLCISLKMFIISTKAWNSWNSESYLSVYLYLSIYLYIYIYNIYFTENQKNSIPFPDIFCTASSDYTIYFHKFFSSKKEKSQFAPGGQ